MSKSRYAIVIILTLAAMTLTMCCKRARTADPSASPASSAKPVTTGITGKVEVWEGNFMPMIEPGKSNNKITPGAGRRVRVHEPVKVEGGMGVAKRESVPTPIVAEVMADSAGHFAIPLPPGTYSIFVEEDGGWYYNGWSGEGIQGAVKVEEGKTTDVLIKITTKATF